MRWPWRRAVSTDRLIVSWSGKTLAYLQARAARGGQTEIVKIGVERQDDDTMEAFVQRLQRLRLQGSELHAVLRPEQYQLLQIDAPAVAPEEMRAAARYQIRDMVEAHIDDITIDVMRVGDGQQKGAGHLFVVVAPNAVLREISDLAKAMDWSLAVVDIIENAQRNLQSALAERNAKASTASAALVVVSERQALLTISASEELFYSRRLELPEGFLTMEWGSSAEIFAEQTDTYTPVGEYVPDYAGGDGLGGAYSSANPSPAANPFATGPSDADRIQRVVVEVQRSLDLWDRTWTTLPLAGLRVYAGTRSTDMAGWLSQEIGQAVLPLEIDSLFPQLQAMTMDDQMACLPLLGGLLRTQTGAP
jgi:MSHA biogenesis protein MshI